MLILNQGTQEMAGYRLLRWARSPETQVRERRESAAASFIVEDLGLLPVEARSDSLSQATETPSSAGWTWRLVSGDS